MEKTGLKMVKYGLVGKNISYSFSREYFRKKFERLGLQGVRYDNYDLQEIGEFPSVISQNPEIRGLNVTIPYKQEIIPFLDRLDPVAEAVGAVNTILVTSKGLTGYNTDVSGFETALLKAMKRPHDRALILGTGGASKAVAYVLDKLKIQFTYVSRKAGENRIAYSDLSPEIIKGHSLLVNTTPLGTFPKVEDKPDIPYEAVGGRHLLFDLIYNPAKTAFLRQGEERGAEIINGLPMLEQQAEKAWEIWNRK